ncbi:MAG: translocation/assembly module TamB domain-containing protein [Saprospiraceae bacterium]|nr:translocation/assembly module TamB domain-containing protein [Saprospiraceae bacterium]
MESGENEISKVSENSLLFVWVKRMVWALILLFLLVVVLLQFATVQTYLSSKVTQYLSEATNTNVSAERLKISPFDGIILQNFNIVDERKDTMLHAGALNISLRKNLFFLLSNELDLNYFGIKGLDMNIVTEQGESLSNLAKFLEKLSSGKKNNESSVPLNLNIKDVDLSDISIIIWDQNKGKRSQLYLTSGVLDINYLDLACNEYDINSILFDRPSFRTYIYDYDCSITDDLEVPQNDNGAIVEDKGEPLNITLRELYVKDGFFGTSNDFVPPDSRYSGMLDYSNFYFENINILLENLSVKQGTDIFATLKTLSAKDNTGFAIHQVSCDTIAISPNTIALKSYLLEMGKTKIKENLRFSFADLSSFSNFTEDVVINAEFKDAYIYLDDLVHFVRSLSKSPFIKNNGKEIIEVNGKYFGKINNLAGRDVAIKLGEKLSLAGSFNTRDLLDSDNTVLNIRLDKFSTSMRKIKMIVPSFNPPDNFYKLGSINFAGRFDGYLEDFVAYGKLGTDLGSAELDMRLDITQGTHKANYSGTLNLVNFNLGKWSGNPDIGLVNFNSKVVEGRGLTLNTVKADLAATIKSLYFKNYQYKDLNLDGKIDKNTFSGTFKVEDDNLNFMFEGNFEYFEKQAFLNFKSKIKKIDLQALNLSQTPLAFQADLDINLAGTGINDFVGDIDIRNIDMKVKDSLYQLDNVYILSRLLAKGGKELKVESDLGSISINGQYDLPNIVRSIKKVLYTNYPSITKPWRQDVAKLISDQKFDFNIDVIKSSNFLSLVGLNNSKFRKLALKGRLDTYKNELSIATDLPLLKVNNDSINDLQLLVTSDSKSGNILLHIDSTYAMGRRFNPIDIQANIVGEELNFEINTEKIIDSLENLDIKGQLKQHAKGYNLTLTENLLVMLGTKWNINPKNNIVFGTEYINLENFILSDGHRTIEFNDFNNNQGISLDVANFNFDIINSIIKYNKMKFGGTTNLNAKLKNVFAKDKEISGYLQIPDFTINDEKYGAVYIDVTKTASDPYKANVAIGDFLAIKGEYNEKEKLVDSRIKLREAPMKLIEYLLKDGIRNTQGFIDADITFGGPTNGLVIDGNGTINKGTTTLIYTGATYYFDNQKLKLTNKKIDLDGAVITDMNGNVGTIKGGLTHDLFKNFGVNATLSGNNVVGLNTTKAQNPDYYGYGVGQLSAEFTGSFDKVDMKITAITGPGTKLFIPVNNSQTAVSQNFIKFVNKEEYNKVENKKNYTLNGINIEMTITITPDAEVSIIFDETKGDIIKGRGRGNLKIDITRLGDFEIFGDYEIESGQYLFTAPLVPLAKPFIVERGGRIVWTGDPINATLDITTKYRTRTSIEPFISEYISGTSEENKNLANQNTEVDVILRLGGSLFKPEINLGLSFPNLTGDIANFADSKLRLLQGNPQELNGQVLGLIVFNSFIQSNRVADAFGTSSIQSASINTLSEFLSSQLSMYITNILNSMVSEGSIISGIDFDVNVRNNTFGLTSSSFVPDEIAVRNTLVFKNDRLSLDIGGNYVFQYQGNAINQVLPDFALEFRLTEDRKLKVRLYGKYDIDVTTFGLREKYGLGVAYRTEFGSMMDFEAKIKKVAAKTINK